MKTTKEIQKEIERRNTIFQAASTKQKRVLIARDVIDQIKRGKFIAEQGTYVSSTALRELAKTVTPLQPVLLGDIEPCNCCAYGSLMLSCTMWNNKSLGRDYYSQFVNYSDYTSNGLRDIFTNKQLVVIECLFEGWIYEKGGKRYYFRDFFDKYTDPNDRLIAIMQHIMDNDGEMNYKELADK